MKTFVHFFILAIISILLTSCPDITPTETVAVKINNSTSQTLNLYYTDKRYLSHWADVSLMPYWSDTLHSLPSSTNHFFGSRFNDKTIRNDVFVAIKNKLTDKQLIVIEEISGDTLAIWNDTSAVFNDQQYWTITATGSKYMTFDCTLNLTDEVLKLK